MDYKERPREVVRTELSAPQTSRRHFIYTSALAAGALATALPAWAARPKFKSPNEKLDIACIGVSGQGGSDAEAVSGENIAALCDVDANNLANARKKYPGARPYSDYRVLLEKEKSIDAVTIGIPDH
jgi:predicted dehydrogenase